MAAAAAGKAKRGVRAMKTMTPTCAQHCQCQTTSSGARQRCVISKRS